MARAASAKVWPSTSEVRSTIEIADVNRDGRPDLVTANDDHSVSVVINRGACPPARRRQREECRSWHGPSPACGTSPRAGRGATNQILARHALLPFSPRRAGRRCRRRMRGLGHERRCDNHEHKISVGLLRPCDGRRRRGRHVPAQELLAALHLPAAGVPVLLIQLHAAMLLAFAIANWMAKGSLMGGI